MSFKRIIMVASAPVALAAFASPAAAQGIPVFDTTTYLQALQTAKQTLTMVDQGRQQIQQAADTFNSLSKLTNVNAIATQLLNSQVRNILPNTTIDAATLLKGDFSQLGALGGLASNIQSRYKLSSSGSDADAAYSAALRDATGSAATMAALGENTLAVSQTRMQGLDQLREQLSSAKDPKDVMDLQARIAVEQAQLQNDMLKMQALQMAQSGEANLQASAAQVSAGRNEAAFFKANTIRK
ncbi:type IV secretion system protein VirB5 [Sphingomonas sp. SORGH_AS 950]|uniref:type IV secretion system protein n=1 Tax=Sphingomonas sp. SORGH_AS_0950 TaxID=3041792 RepID=UPI002784EDA0|nr:type IV secretion system protein [Sphingomonas sp. SORGH_AS_0950]MDQ1159601.1 type IV secretion system protein VirB5 [Sphingomonas sp. SORGH_AS_0950]